MIATSKMLPMTAPTIIPVLDWLTTDEKLKLILKQIIYYIYNLQLLFHSSPSSILDFYALCVILVYFFTTLFSNIEFESNIWTKHFYKVVLEQFCEFQKIF